MLIDKTVMYDSTYGKMAIDIEKSINKENYYMDKLFQKHKKRINKIVNNKIIKRKYKDWSIRRANSIYNENMKRIRSKNK